MDNRFSSRDQGNHGREHNHGQYGQQHRPYDPQRRYGGEFNDQHRFSGNHWDEQPGHDWRDENHNQGRYSNPRQNAWSQDAQFGTPHYTGQGYSSWTPDSLAATDHDFGRDSNSDLSRNFAGRDLGGTPDRGFDRNFDRDYGRNLSSQRRYGADYQRDMGSAYDRYQRLSELGNETRDPYGFGSRYASQYSPGNPQSQERWQSQNWAHAGRGPKGYQRSDDKLKEMICERLTESPYIDASDVSVTVSKGAVTLEGSVSERHLRHQIENLVEACGGVKDIHNNLRVSNGVEAGQSTRAGRIIGENLDEPETSGLSRSRKN